VLRGLHGELVDVAGLASLLVLGAQCLGVVALRGAARPGVAELLNQSVPLSAQLLGLADQELEADP
jgi:hypothetical protein